MKRPDKAVKAASYVAGICAISAAMLLVVFLALSMIGLIHPRTQHITLHTPSISKIYDGLPLQGSMPELRYGMLHPGHAIEVRHIPTYTQVGEHENAPQVVIVDETGADVTAQYEINRDFGTMTVSARPIMLSSLSKSKVYDGELLTADDAVLTGGALVEGHTLITEGGNTVLLPGEEPVQAVYRIVSEDGSDVTGQYEVQENFGKLRVFPIDITVTTETAKKAYDGKPLTACGWEHIGGTLLPGHTIDMQMMASLNDVGTIPNEGKAVITDTNGTDVGEIYHIDYRFGSLEIEPIPLRITTKSAQKIYDGTPLVCEDWTLTAGKLEQGAVLSVREYAVQQGVGSIDNAIGFQVIDETGRDITYHYDMVCDYGTLSVQPRAITIRTDSAQKVYDGTPLNCNTFMIVNGSLCAGEQISIVCTSMTEVGYSDNYVLECSIYRQEGDNITEVTACYRIIFDFGTLKITAD